MNSFLLEWGWLVDGGIWKVFVEIFGVLRDELWLNF